MKYLILSLFLSAVSLAHDKHFATDGDMYASPLLDLDKPGTEKGEPQKGEGDLYGSHLVNPQDVQPNPNAHPEPVDPKERLHEQDPEDYGLGF